MEYPLDRDRRSRRPASPLPRRGADIELPISKSPCELEPAIQSKETTIVMRSRKAVLFRRKVLFRPIAVSLS